jgi:hypothetical protein
MAISQAEVRRLLDYDPKTGEFTWRERKKGRETKVGWTTHDGRQQVSINYKKYYLHRLAYLWMTGDLPKFIDHIDGDPGNNAWGNLRMATHAQNLRNTKLRSTNRSGFKGVAWNFAVSKWTAQIVTNGKKTHLGCFSSPEEAAAAYADAAKLHHGEFARLG